MNKASIRYGVIHVEDFEGGLKRGNGKKKNCKRGNLSLVGRHSPLGPSSLAFLATLEVLEGPKRKR